MRRILSLLLCTVLVGVLMPAARAAAAKKPKSPAPTHSDVTYSEKYERSVLDFWKAESDTPTPLVVYFHGGGFTQGDKDHFKRSQMLAMYYPKGVSFASVNYPFLQHTGSDFRAILQHTEVAVKFLGSKAKEWNIDPRRIAVAGSSAGALISEYLAYGTKLPIRAVYATLQPMGTDGMILPLIGKGGPPIVVYNFTGPDDQVHHVRYATMVGERCKKVGVPCEVWGTKANGLPTLPDGESMDAHVMKVFYKAWKLGPDGKELETPAAKAARLRAEQAESEFAAAEQLVTDKQPAEAAREFRRLASAHVGADVGMRAAVRLKALTADPAVAAALIDPEADAFEARCLAAENKKDYALAIQLYEQYVKRFTRATRFEKVQAHLASLKSDKTIQAAIASGQAGKECKSWLAMADNYIKAGLTDKARQYLTKIIDKHGDTDWGAQARARLAEIENK
jgi:acetyl esterase/lipase